MKSENYVGKGLKKRTTEECIKLGLNPNPNPPGSFAPKTLEDFAEAGRRGADTLKRVLGIKTEEDFANAADREVKRFRKLVGSTLLEEDEKES